MIRCKNRRKVALNEIKLRFFLCWWIIVVTFQDSMAVRKLIYRSFAALSLLILFSDCVAIKDLNYTLEGTRIDLSRKGLTRIPDEVFDQTETKVLRLFGNKIDSISDRIGELVNLEELFIGRNELTSLPAAIGQLKKLRVLYVENNRLESLPEEIGNLPLLEEVRLGQNQLVSLPESIGKLKNLVFLKLSYNSIESLPAAIGECSNLGFLYLNRNNLQDLPESMSKLNRLKEIYLSGAGPLLQVPESMCGLRYLELINIDNSIALPPCMYVLQANRLQIVQQ
ncbi:MAG: Leucine-rich repeat (LRR) protein [Flavobacteriaceae bacterium]|jgi:Leucine-rich repeat (LRR) protein